MLSYQHAYHAGNFADVHKHALLCLALTLLQRKPAPLACLETHAGRGSYNLEGDAARRSGEWRDGIGRLWATADAPADLLPYLDAVRAANSGKLARYPGSPALVRHLLRADDRAVLMELHPHEGAELKALYRGDRQVAVHLRDGFEGLPPLVPPATRRGLVLVDPSYEVKEDYAAVPALVQQAHRRWPGGSYLVWYPLLAAGRERRLREAFRRSGMRPILDTQLVVARAGRGMHGSGLLVVNPPWPLAERWAPLGDWLATRLARETGHATSDWLVPE
ncbi:MAG TPA: 23S rRNA (adenine(2030)-N(6))-methyltransferase RlmJ [Gammaproteobacteria bacterium]